jgi:hypothetical protein
MEQNTQLLGKTPATCDTIVSLGNNVEKVNEPPLDPISEGTDIFSRELGEYGDAILSDPAEVEKILRRLLSATRGLVILDFLDARNWDRVDDFVLEHDSRHLRLTWHDYRATDSKPISSEEREMSRLAFPASYYGMFMHLDIVRIIPASPFPLLALKGYALTEKEIRRLLRPGSEEFNISSQAFSSRVIRKIEGLWELITCHSFASFTALMLPKKSGLLSCDSKSLLYVLNVTELQSRLSRVQRDLQDKARDRDRLCDLGNSARRIFEAALKIEALFREVDLQKPYSQLLLGDLISMIKPLHGDEVGRVFGVIAELSNKMSHDSGKPVEKVDVDRLADMILRYLEMLSIEIQSDIRPNRGRRRRR